MLYYRWPFLHHRQITNYHTRHRDSLLADNIIPKGVLLALTDKKYHWITFVFCAQVT